MQIYNVYQSGKRLYIDEKENPDNKIVVNKYDNMQQTLRLISDGTLPPRLYWALRNPKLSNKYFILKLVNNEDLIVGTDISAYAGLWDMLLIGTDEDYIIEGADIDQSRLTYVSDHFGRLFVRDNFLEELDFEEQCSPTFKIFYDEIMFQLDEKADTKDIPDKLSDFENDTNFISGFDTVEDGNGNVTIVDGVYGNFTFNIDSELSETSPRPVQNKVITSKLNEIDYIVQETDKKTDEALIIAKGANNSLVYGNYSTMITSLNAMQGENLKVGQNLLIVTLNVPDLWISEITDVHLNYEYVSDEQFVTDLADGTVQVGYYVLSPLETQKVDLTEYVKNTDYATNQTVGLVRGGGYGVTVISNGLLGCQRATESEIDVRNSAVGDYKPIVPRTLDYATMKALTDPKNIAWNDTQKALARATLGAVGSNEYVSTPSSGQKGKYGVVRLRDGMGISAAFEGAIYVVTPTNAEIDERTQKYEPITPSNLDYAVKKALSDCKLTGDDVWTDEEKAKALETLGGMSKPKKPQYVSVICMDTGGNVLLTRYSATNTPYTITQRTERGTVVTDTPIVDNDATTKKYVDDLVGSVESILTELHAYAETKIGGES